jgi:hypothetical protein
MEANIRRMNAANANKNNMSGGPKTMGMFTLNEKSSQAHLRANDFLMIIWLMPIFLSPFHFSFSSLTA